MSLNLCDVIVMDEISMISPIKWSVIHYRLCLATSKLAPFGGKQVIAFGDFSQLPPVEEGEEQVHYAFESECWKYVFPIGSIRELVKSFRQNDPAFVEFLDRVRLGFVTDEEMMNLVAESKARREAMDPTLKEFFRLRLFGSRAKAKLYNQQEQAKLKALGKTTHVFEWTTECVPWTTNEQSKHTQKVQLLRKQRPSMVASEYDRRVKQLVEPVKRDTEAAMSQLKRQAVAVSVLELSIGTRVMLSHNVDVAKGLFRNKVGTVTHFDEFDTWPYVLFEGELYAQKILPYEWHVLSAAGRWKAKQLPLEYAWAITIHKSQSLSLDAASIDLSEVFAYETKALVSFSTFFQSLH
jgi:ATP-dependent DNA helicase PIF1